ncbi:hypothetical protein Sru01_27800 [Sphaerisporangium rufum]|uniref:Lytic transglycosylase domain-containing protein n=1 Tax=Sphaerisporangium rufum TaxID=1381558 RepID=A0A919R2D8_9ACTN|nr:lytic transglycosylase domain-containing protein [Sphaerisporangium rufum]GII77798.1 hypothetical protein Sru01_27800 [Sphaerisporangium rufum]
MRDKPGTDEYARPPRGRARQRGSLLTPKRVAGAGVSLALVGALGVFTVRTMQENAELARTTKPLLLDDFSRMAGDPFAPDPKADALKLQAAQAARARALQDSRDDGAPKWSPIKIVKKAPGGAGFNASAFPPGSKPNPGSNKAIGQKMNAARGWASEWGCLERLWDKESGWNERAMNRSSGAYGVPQSLPGSKMASAGADWQTNPATQIKWGLGYIASRYKSPCGAWAHSQSVGWY